MQKEKKTISVALIGGGKISEQHIKALKQIDSTEIAGICDLSESLVKFTAERFHINHWYTDYMKMLNDLKPDVVHILTPPATHDRLVRDSIDAGSHVVVEKPISLSNKGFRELYEYASQKGKKLIENHNYRFNSPVLKLDKAVSSGRLGDVKEVEVRLSLNIRGGGRYADENLPHPSHKLPAGIIHEFITHLSYLLLHFMPSGSMAKMDDIRAAWRNHGGGDLYKYDDLDALLIVQDVHGRIRFSCQQWPDNFSIQVRGTKGTAFAELYNPVFVETIPRSGGQNLTPLFNSFHAARNHFRSGFGSIWGKIRDVGAYDGLRRHLELIYKAMSENGVYPVEFEQMDDASKMIDALLKPEHAI